MDSSSHQPWVNSWPNWSPTRWPRRFPGCGYPDSSALGLHVQNTTRSRVPLLTRRCRFPYDSLRVDPRWRRVNRRRRSQGRYRVLWKRSFRPITVGLTPFIDDAPQGLIARHEPRCGGLAGAATVRHFAQPLAQIPDEGSSLVLVEVRGEWKDTVIARLQKPYDAVHEPVVVPLLRIDLRHTSPL